MKPIVFVKTAYHALKAAKKAARAVFVTARNVELIRASQFFDAEWYLKENRDVARVHMDPAMHYLRYGGLSGRDPSPEFCSEEYLDLNGDVLYAKMNPLLHYEQYGKREKRPISVEDFKEPTFPEGVVEIRRDFGISPRRTGRTAIFAAYFGSGRIPDTTILYLKGLKTVADNIVMIGDCPVFEDELSKLDGIVSCAWFVRHREYDFGSYKRGYETASRMGLLENIDELVVANDSCYAPVFPLEEAFEAMSGRDCDFWGMTPYHAMGRLHIQSFFYVFRGHELITGPVGEFLSGVTACSERWQVIVRYELQFTHFLTEKGYSFDTYLPKGAIRGNPMKHPLASMKNHRLPLVKVKAIGGDSFDSINAVVSFVEKQNPALGVSLREKLQKSATSATPAPRPSIVERHIAAYPAKLAKLKKAIEDGEKLKAVFFVTSTSMFAAKPLFDAMLKDSLFDPFICVVPDKRLKSGAMKKMEQTEEEVSAQYGESRLIIVRPQELGIWPEVTADAAIAVYSLPYTVSPFRYTPRYAVGRDFLAINVNYGYYRSIYDHSITMQQNYAWFWKAFVECDDNLKEYLENSILRGANADVVGYIKMDALADMMVDAAHQSRKAKRHGRKKILLAPHHSVDGGANEILALSNFSRYADFFLALPDRYSKIDFIFRPHPFLFVELAKPNQWGKKRVEEYIAAMKAKPNVTWSDGGDYFQEFAQSDACIQDCGSYLVEYFYTKKPCCYMLKSPDDIEKKFAPLGKKCLENCYIAYDTDAIDQFISNVVVKGDDPKKTQREAFADTIMVNYPHASDTALEHIKRDILSAKS